MVKINTTQNTTAIKIFTPEEENELVNYIVTIAKMHYGLTLLDIRKLGYKFASAKGKNFPDKWNVDKMASKQWLCGFMKRHSSEVSLRKPEATGLGRSTAFNQHTVAEFFENLDTVHQKYGPFTPDRIYNVDEHGLTTVQTPAKIVASRGQKQVGSITSAERGALVTLIAAANVAGNRAPPMMVFPRVNFKEHLLVGAPKETIGEANQSGWSNERIFLSWLKHFVKFTSASKTNRVLLILDNHESHMAYKNIEFARGNGVIMLTIPPHTSHRLQPLDVSVFGPLKKYYGNAVDTWHRNNPGKTFSIYFISEAFGQSYDREFCPENIKAGFAATGIGPYKPTIFKDHDFLCSSVTDRPDPTIQAENEAEPELVNIPISEGITPANSSNTDSQNSTLTPQDIAPYPKAGPRVISNRSRKRGKTTILTLTPEKATEIQNSKQKKKAPAPPKSKRPKNNFVEFEESESGTESEECKSSESDDTDSESVLAEELPSDDKDNYLMLGVHLSEIAIDNYYCVKFVTEQDQKIKYYAGKVLSVDQNNEIKVKFLRRKRKDDPIFVYPNKDDVMDVSINDMICRLTLIHERRGYLTFNNVPKECL